MTQPLTGDRSFRDDVVRIAALTVNTATIEGYTFSNCRIVGPAILALLGDVTIRHCGWDAPGFDAIFWGVPEDRGAVVGVVGLRNCTFSNCTFENIGIAAPEAQRDELAAGFGF